MNKRHCLGDQFKFMNDTVSNAWMSTALFTSLRVAIILGLGIMR